eukprot:NODE_2254_length_612_cov_269.420619_g2204_i0.p1 GENE.NODE_2254_length_612_cov_269.420619_g2204_i0~~NODE_2254_length_612_cov_269.420619_g2204_i0.p1  ORF type:complete len:150 (+),score=39.25 NODE_2254_length_612_cov_269.420619_g2204_i0:73-522(+)
MRASRRASIQPGSILVLLAGKYRGRRVVFLDWLKDGVMLITGPHKINGVPLRRLDPAYCIVTSEKVDLKGLKTGIDASFFKREKKERATNEKEEFMEKKEEKKELPAARKQKQAEVDGKVISSLSKEHTQYLKSLFSLKKNDRPHTMKF